jgi:hypothetical protein
VADTRGRRRDWNICRRFKRVSDGGLEVDSEGGRSASRISRAAASSIEEDTPWACANGETFLAREKGGAWHRQFGKKSDSAEGAGPYSEA